MEIIVNCERCGKEERITQKFLGNARKQGDQIVVAIKAEDLFFGEFEPIKIDGVRPEVEFISRGQILDAFLLCGECREKIVKGLEKLVAKLSSMRSIGSCSLVRSDDKKKSHCISETQLGCASHWRNETQNVSASQGLRVAHGKGAFLFQRKGGERRWITYR